MSRIAQRFAQLKEQGRKALVTYSVAGDPDAETSLKMLHEMVARGADILEVGVPFSDPMAEGPVIQQAHERALANRLTLTAVIELVAVFRATDNQTPVLLMGYANPVEHMGYAHFADVASAAGVDALLTVDLPPEEVAPIKAELSRVGMDCILLVAPTTPDARLVKIVKQASGFVYSVSLKGVTGSGHLDSNVVAEQVARIRQHTALPVAVGFGIRDATSARAIAAVADGVVVGSALVAAAAEAGQGGPEAAVAAAGALVAEIRQGIDSLAS